MGKEVGNMLSHNFSGIQGNLFSTCVHSLPYLEQRPRQPYRNLFVAGSSLVDLVNKESVSTGNSRAYLDQGLQSPTEDGYKACGLSMMQSTRFWNTTAVWR